MTKISDLLRDADPLRHEPTWRPDQQNLRRAAILATASGARAPSGVRSRSRKVVFATIALAAVATAFLGSRVWSVFVSDLQAAAIRFEVRLAEDKPAPGLREVKLSGSDRSIYIHDEVVVTNSDIAVARVVPGSRPSEFNVAIELNSAGAEKMRAATANHIGKPIAILLDGQVVMAPGLRTLIGASARITGNFTRTQAERIVKGIEIQ
jgi:antitoxin (DNA-binding transcriptional repressor) of toxin-antitoxin stability system